MYLWGAWNEIQKSGYPDFWSPFFPRNSKGLRTSNRAARRGVNLSVTMNRIGLAPV